MKCNVVFLKLYVINQIKILEFINDKGAVYKGCPANGEGVVLKFRTVPDGGRGVVRTSENF